MLRFRRRGTGGVRFWWSDSITCCPVIHLLFPYSQLLSVNVDIELNMETVQRPLHDPFRMCGLACLVVIRHFPCYSIRRWLSFTQFRPLCHFRGSASPTSYTDAFQPVTSTCSISKQKNCWRSVRTPLLRGRGKMWRNLFESSFRTILSFMHMKWLSLHDLQT